MTALSLNRPRSRRQNFSHLGLFLFIPAIFGSSNLAFGQVVYAVNSGNDISAFTLDVRSGLPKAVPGSPFAAGRTPVAVAVHPTSKFVFVANAGSNDISVYVADSAGALSPVSNSPFRAGLTPAALAVDPSGKFLYVINSGSSDVSAYAIDAENGALTPVAGSPFMAGAVPAGVAVHPNGRFLLVANSGSGTVSEYAIEPLTGALSMVSGSPFRAGGSPKSIAIDRAGRFAYIAIEGGVSAFAINSDSGEMTAVPDSPFALGDGPVSVAVNPNGKFVYVANGEDLSTYALDSGTGALTLVPGSRFTGGLRSGLVNDSTGRFVYQPNALPTKFSAYRVDSNTGILMPGMRSLSRARSPLDGGAIAVAHLALSGTPLITTFTMGTARNNYTGGFGMKFTVGATALNVSALGRIFITGNTGMHVVKLVRALDGVDVPGGAVTVDLSSGTAGQFTYAQLASPVTLAPNTSYYLISQETDGGDQFFDLGSVTPTSAVAVDSGIVFSTLTGYIAVGPPNDSYVPVNLLYTAAGAPPSVAITVPVPGAAVSGNNVPVSATATAGAGQTITSVQFQVDNVNQGAPVTSSPYGIALDTTKLSNGPHTLTAVALDSTNTSGTSAPVSITVNNHPTVTITAPVAGATVSGNNVALSATAVAATGLTIANVQFKVDNVNQGAPVTVSPYSTVLDSTTLSNSTHTVLAVATDSAGNMTTSAPASFTVNNSTTSIAITSPAAGATVSGPVPITATVTPGPGITIAKVQFQVDNVNQGAAVTSSPYTITLDTTALTNGTHTLLAIATDSNNKTVSSVPIGITVGNAVPPPAGTALISSFISGTPRNNSTGGFGMRFTVGAAALNVSALGRIYIAGNTGSHVVKLVRVSDGLDVPGGAVTITLPSGAPGQFAYAQLASPVTLDPGKSYYLISQETNGGDQFYDLGSVTPTNAVTVNSGVVNSPGIGFLNVGPPNDSFVPVNFIYTSAGIPPTVAITAPLDGSTISGNNVAVTATATADAGLTISSVQFQVDNVNQGAPVTSSPYGIVLDATKLSAGPHTLTAIATDSANKTATSATVTVTVNNNPTVTVTAPLAGATVAGKTVTLSANAVAATGFTITSVQFKVDNVNQGVPVAASPYSIVLDSTTLSNASHTVVAVATDSANHTTTSTPVSFNVDNSTTTVSITTPSAGATVSGSVPVSATASAGPGLTITKVQFQVDNVNQGAAVTTSPYSIVLDTTQLSNGPHTLLALATDSANKTVSSAPVSITVNNAAAPPPSGAALITAFSTGFPRKSDGGFGMRFTVGPMPLTVTALGRIYIQGNTGSHLVKLARASDGVDVPGGSVTISLPSGTPGQFAYAQLASPVTLDANTSYYLVSIETSGGDQFYDLGPVTSTNKATVNSGVAYSPGLGFYSSIGLANSSFVPVNLLYATSSPAPTVSISGPAGGATVSGNNVPVSATAVASAGLTITKVQFQVDNVNQGAPVTSSPYGIVLDTTKLSNGSHSLTAIATDSANMSTTSAGVSITVKNNPTIVVTAPVAGSTVSGNSVQLTATATAATGLTIKQVQFLVDNANQGAPVTTSPYSVNLDKTALTNATHIVVAVATDSANNTTTSLPVSFTVNNSANNVTTVIITAPATGSTVSGSVNVLATATPGPGLTITKVQFQLDNANQGAAVTSSPYSITLDTTTLTNGPHSLVAIATDSSNKTAPSQAVSITVSNGVPPQSGKPIITGFTGSKLRNDFTGGEGMKFTVGAQPLTVTALGRIYIAGNTGSHVVKLVRASDGMDVPGGAVTITLPSGNPGNFVYGLLPSPVTLDANGVYYLVSFETSGGDQFYDLSSVTATTEITITNGVGYQPGIGFIPVGGPNSSFVPVNMLH
jgi:6-phosphogluconolactonase (cycloisomerase 2 family)